MKLKMLLSLSVLALLIMPMAEAVIYPLPYKGARLIGELQTTTVRPGDTLASIARAFNMGFYELVEANRNNVRSFEPLPAYSHLVIPSLHILPDLPQEGIVINLDEMRLYYFLTSGKAVMTVPIGIGRVDWDTPTGLMRIVEKRANPTWFIPDSIRKAQEEKGIILPDSVPPGPENPLGHYAMRLSNRQYLIHGTNRPEGIGKRITSGCIRLLPEDIEDLFNRVSKGTRVHITTQPYKLAWFQDAFYLEVHEPLPEHQPPDLLAAVTNHIKNSQRNHPQALIDWQKVKKIVRDQDGIPHRISGSY